MPLSSAALPRSAGPLPPVLAGGPAVRVRVRLFASLREQAGWSERLVCPADDPATPLGLWRQLQLAQVWAVAMGSAIASPSGAQGSPLAGEAAPACGAAGADPPRRDGVPPGAVLPLGVRVAINQAFAAADTPLRDGDELAFLPPISGG